MSIISPYDYAHVKRSSHIGYKILDKLKRALKFLVSDAHTAICALWAWGMDFNAANHMYGSFFLQMIP